MPLDADLAAYDLVVLPTIYTASDADAARVAAAAEAGTHIVVSFFSGIVDEQDRIRLGGYPGDFRELLGVRSEEFYALQEGETLYLDDGTAADLWSEKTHLEGAEAVRIWADGELAGLPAVTRREIGGTGGTGGSGGAAAWYVAARPSADGLRALVAQIAEGAGVGPVLPGLARDVEAVRRIAEDGTSFLFVLNHSDADQVIAVRGRELLAGADADGALLVPAGGSAVVQEA